MSVKKILNDEKLKNILNKYSKENEIGDKLFSILRNNQEKEIIIPVVGMQGMGKSTLINAILEENILPNEADETTCIPVEVKYGENCAIVYFGNSESMKIPCTVESLSNYVDNKFNYGNEKGVSHIVLHRKIDLLKNGLTIVDLPGIGSLTKENQETTCRYIENLCTAIFIIPTVPTIRKTEQIFIKGMWMNFNSIIFVQNSFGESIKEIKESVEYNRKVLRDIAKTIHRSYDDEISVINAYDAITGALGHNKEKVQTSNITNLINKIEKMVFNWNENRENSNREIVLAYIYSCKNEIKTILDKIELSDMELKKKLKKEEEDFENKNKELKSIIERIEIYLSQKEEEVIEFATQQSEECCENIRSNIYRIIDSGVVDGKQLTEAFKNYQTMYLDDVINNFFDFSIMTQSELIDLLKELGNIIEGEKIFIDVKDFKKEEALKFEKGLEGLGGLLGLRLAFCLEPFSVFLGIGTTIVFNIVGKKMKDFIVGQRARKTKKQIEPKINELEDEIKKQIINEFKIMKNNIKEELKRFKEDRENSLKQQKDKNKKLLMGNRDSVLNKSVLEEDYNYLVHKERDING